MKKLLTVLYIHFDHIIYRYIPLLFLFTVACNKSLIENPKSVAVETFYNTAAELEAAVNSVYSPLRDGNTNGMGVYIAVLEGHSDYGIGRGSYSVLNDFAGLNSVIITRVSGVWEAFYLSIRNANLVIKNAPHANAANAEQISRTIAEAKFLRAFDYFHLVRNWSGVPIRTEDNMEEPDVKRATPDEVYALITEDLLEAENNLPDIAAVPGKPTKWSAKTLLADVYLERKLYTQSRDKANEVIQSGKYALIPVSSSDDFQKIFGPDVITSSEEVFYLKFSHLTGQGNLWPELTNHPGTKLLGSGGVYGLHSDALNLVISNWDNNDLRKGIWYNWNIGLGATSLLSKKFIDPNSIAFGGAANDLPWYRYADVLLIYAEAATRAANEPTTEAVEALNQVHRRAYGYAPATPSPADFVITDYNADSFVDLVIKERGYEFQFEGKRWHELKRTGKAAATILAVKNKVIADKHYLWPLPVSEISFNNAIDPVADQNPGY